MIWLALYGGDTLFGFLLFSALSVGYTYLLTSELKRWWKGRR